MDGTTRNTGAEGLLEILCRGLERYARQRTAILLGDRSRYVGLSDIAKMLDCPRAALAARLFTPEHRNTAEALKRRITFHRGHWLETGVHQALVGYGLSPLSQLEIEIMYGDVPIKAHLDGVSYQIVPAQDGRECILATGNTAEKKEQLSAAGFHWNPQRKIWWKYAA